MVTKFPNVSGSILIDQVKDHVIFIYLKQNLSIRFLFRRSIYSNTSKWLARYISVSEKGLKVLQGNSYTLEILLVFYPLLTIALLFRGMMTNICMIKHCCLKTLKRLAGKPMFHCCCVFNLVMVTLIILLPPLLMITSNIMLKLLGLVKLCALPRSIPLMFSFMFQISLSCLHLYFNFFYNDLYFKLVFYVSAFVLNWSL